MVSVSQYEITEEPAVERPSRIDRSDQFCFVRS